MGGIGTFEKVSGEGRREGEAGREGGEGRRRGKAGREGGKGRRRGKAEREGGEGRREGGYPPLAVVENPLGLPQRAIHPRSRGRHSF